VAKRPGTITITIDGKAARPADVRRVAADASRQRGKLTRELNGTSGRPRSQRRREAKEQREHDRAAARDEAKMGQALRKQQRLEQRAMRDDDIASRRAHRKMQRALATARGQSTGKMPIIATVMARPSAPAGWMALAGDRSSGPLAGNWKRAEDGLRSVHLNVSSAVTGSKSTVAGKKARPWRRADAVGHALYCARDHSDGAGENDIVTNMLTGRVQHVRNRDDFERVLACVDAAEQVESEAAQPGRPHTMFKKLIFSLPAELGVHAHHQIMRRMAGYFAKQNVPILLARHTPDDPQNSNIHVHGHVIERHFAVLGPDRWAFSAERSDVLCKASLAELRLELADAFNEQLLRAGFEPDFIHLSRLARGLAPSADRHRGRPKAKPLTQVTSTAVDVLQIASPEPFTLDDGTDTVIRGTEAVTNPRREGRPANAARTEDPAAEPSRPSVSLAPPPLELPLEMYTSGNRRPFNPAKAQVSIGIPEPSGPVVQPGSFNKPANTRPAVPRDETEVGSSFDQRADRHPQPTDKMGREIADAFAEAARRALGTVLAPARWLTEAAERKRQAEEQQRQAELARQAEEEERRRQWERDDALHAYWRHELFNILARNPRLERAQSDGLRDARLFDEPEDHRFVEQVYEHYGWPDTRQFEIAYAQARLDAREYVNRVQAREARRSVHVAEQPRSPVRSAQTERQIEGALVPRMPSKGGGRGVSK